jgi:hypothetical protein
MGFGGLARSGKPVIPTHDMYHLQVSCACKPHRPLEEEACAETLVVKQQPSFKVAFLCEKRKTGVKCVR